jgi:predicted O-methyltransferase YrrM
LEKISARESAALVDLVQVTKAQRLIEFGTWQGRSALAFLMEATKAHPQATITCVDTWLGSSEHWASVFKKGEWAFENLAIVEGEPTFIETFRAAIREHGFSNNVKILRCPTAFSESYLAENATNPDLFYIDADHSSAAVMEDIAIASRITTHGLVCGDDWGWRTVRWGVLKSAVRLGVDMFVSPDKKTWALGKRGQRTFTDALVERGWKKAPRLTVLGSLMARQLRQILRGVHRTHR